MIMKRLLAYFGMFLLACGCGLDEPALSDAGGSLIEFSASKMRVITKAGDSAEPFDDGTKFKLFAVEDSDGAHNWSNTVLYDRSGVLASGLVSYGDKVSYGVDPLNVLDFYGVTNGTESEVPVSGPEGQTPKVAVVCGTDGRLPDLMYSDNLKSKTSASGRLEMEFRHTMAKLNIEILKQDETLDSDKKLVDAKLDKIVLKGTGVSGTFNVETGLWESVEQDAAGIMIFDGSWVITTEAQTVVSDQLTIPVTDGKVSLDVYLSGIVGAKDNPITYTLTIGKDSGGNDMYLNLEQNHEYTLSVAVLKNDVRIVTVTPKVYEWIDVELDTGDAYFGQPVYFGGLMWMDRNLGAKSADCENDWYNTIGYYYQHGRNIPYMFDVDVWKTRFNTSSKVSFSNNKFTHGLIYSLNENHERISEYIPASGSGAPESNLPYYDQVAKNPGDVGVDYRFICGFNSWSSWARGTNNLQDPRNDVYWDDVANQPCPKGWRLPTRKDMYKYLPEEFYSEAVWQHTYTQGNMLKYDYYSGNRNSLGEEYKWKYFTAKFKAASSQTGEWSYPVPDEYSRVYLIKYEGTSKAYRIMIEQRKANTVDDGGVVKKYVRISRFEAMSNDEFLISPDGKQWNLHKFDWDTPAEYMDFPLCGYIDPGDGSNSIIKHHPYLGAFGNGCILRSQEIDVTGSLGRNWTMYFMDTYRGVTVGGGSRRSLGDQVRCVRDVSAK